MITIQQILKEVKSVRGGLVGISRTNKALHFRLTKQLGNLEADLISTCDKLVAGQEKIKGAEGVDTLTLAESIEVTDRALNDLRKEFKDTHIDKGESEAILDNALNMCNEGFLKHLNDDSLSKAEIITILTPDKVVVSANPNPINGPAGAGIGIPKK